MTAGKRLAIQLPQGSGTAANILQEAGGPPEGGTSKALGKQISRYYRAGCPDAKGSLNCIYPGAAAFNLQRDTIHTRPEEESVVSCLEWCCNAVVRQDHHRSVSCAEQPLESRIASEPSCSERSIER